MYIYIYMYSPKYNTPSELGGSRDGRRREIARILLRTRTFLLIKQQENGFQVFTPTSPTERCG